jgi:hypothetical protein
MQKKPTEVSESSKIKSVKKKTVFTDPNGTGRMQELGKKLEPVTVETLK